MEIMTINGEEVEVLIPLKEPDAFAPAKAPDELTSGAEKLPFYLSRTAGVDVTVKVSQVIELIGEEKANQLCIMCNRVSEGRNRQHKRGSNIPASRRVRVEALAMYNRKDLLDAIEEVQGTTPMDDEVILPRKMKGEPDHLLLSKAKKKAGVPLGEKDKENLKSIQSPSS